MRVRSLGNEDSQSGSEAAVIAEDPSWSLMKAMIADLGTEWETPTPSEASRCVFVQCLDYTSLRESINTLTRLFKQLGRALGRTGRCKDRLLGDKEDW